MTDVARRHARVAGHRAIRARRGAAPAASRPIRRIRHVPADLHRPIAPLAPPRPNDAASPVSYENLTCC
ncbi:hypothetical protein BURPS1106B_0036 [Burkholderia pseudomallei 1106b]|nr:hypothetical protein BURPS1106B_0036 [Burkholderia pseudomallei 1106b]